MESQKLKEKIKNEEHWLRSVVMPEMIKTNKFEHTNDANAIKIGRIAIKFIGIEEAFMLTNCYRANIEYEFQHRKHQRCLVVKKTPQIPAEFYDAVCFSALFSNEFIAYTIIMPAIQNFIKSPFNVPKYYYSDIQKCGATMILEDFGVDGWRVPKEKVNLSLEHILTAVNYLGEFHGIGFAMRALQRQEFDAITSNLKEPRYDCQLIDDWDLTQKVSLQRVLKATRQYETKVSEEFLQMFEKLLSVEEPAVYGRQRVSPREPFITLCHGDFLRNNIAFQYEEKLEEKKKKYKPIKTMMFDLQTIRISSPMIDLVVLLSLSTFAEVRYKNFQQIFTQYCEALNKSYEKYAKQKPPKYLSHSALLKEFTIFMPYGIQIASFFLPLLIEPDEMSSETFLQTQFGVEEITNIAMNRGGEVANKELSHQMKELYDLVQEHGVDICENIKLNK